MARDTWGKKFYTQGVAAGSCRERRAKVLGKSGDGNNVLKGRKQGGAPVEF